MPITTPTTTTSTTTSTTTTTTTTTTVGSAKVDPSALFAMIFGSDKFLPLVGTFVPVMLASLQ